MKTVGRWFSEQVDHDMTLIRWGHWGRPVLVLPSAGGDAEEIERNGLIDACGGLLAEGRVKIYSVDSIAGQAMMQKWGSPQYRRWLLNAFHGYVREEVIPAIRADVADSTAQVITAGASIGAFNAVALLCRYPDTFSAALGMSGTKVLAHGGRPGTPKGFRTAWTTGGQSMSTTGRRGIECCRVICPS
jgi:esterase/lipase superfamily enzyme